jgi:hypothetical protein
MRASFPSDKCGANGSTSGGESVDFPMATSARQHSDVTSEVARVVIIDTSLSKVDELCM